MLRGLLLLFSWAQALYSSFQCTGGSQKFSFPLQDMGGGFPSPISPMLRVCQFENICINASGALVLHMHPTYYRELPLAYQMEAFTPGQPLLATSIFGGFHGNIFRKTFPPFTVHTKLASVPNDVTWAPRSVYLLESVSYADNIGHYLMDSVMPQQFAADMFDFSLEDAQLLLQVGCDFLQGNNPYHPGRTRAQECQRIYDEMSPYFYRHAVRSLASMKPPSGNVCFRKLIAGQSSAFSLYSFELARAGFARRARDALWRRLNITAPPRDKLSTKILVALKTPGFQGGAAWPKLCQDVKKIATTTNVDCVDPVPLSLPERVKLVLNYGIIIAEHGTLSYLALFAATGTTLITIGNKEPRVLLYLTHIKTYYLQVQQARDLESLLMFIQSPTDDQRVFKSIKNTTLAKKLEKFST